MIKRKNILAFIITYLVSRFIYILLDFEYDFLIEGINIKLIIDLSMWIIIFIIVSWLLEKIDKN